jgi:O-Antigen ligase
MCCFFESEDQNFNKLKMLKKYLAYSSVLAIFSEAVNYHYIIDLKLFYIIILFNSVLLISLKSFKLNLNLFFILLALFIHGIIGVILVSYPIQSLISQLLGISISSLFYFNLIRYFGTSYLFKIYIKYVFFVSVIGLIMFLLTIKIGEEERFHSILSEPSRFAIIMIPSLYYLYKNKLYFKLSLVTFCIILSQSSIGYLGLLLLIIIPNIRSGFFKKALKILPLLILFIFILSKNENFKLRYDETIDSLKIFETKKFERTVNSSSYALLSNAYIAINNFLDHPLGTGLGSYETIYDVYKKELTLPYNIAVNKSDELNKSDANSLFLRIFSDLGIFGLVLIIAFFYLFYKLFKNKTTDLSIMYGLLVYFLLKLLRQGHYFPPEFYFFMFLFFSHLKELKTAFYPTKSLT